MGQKGTGSLGLADANDYIQDGETRNYTEDPGRDNNGLLWWLSVKELTCRCRRLEFYPWVGKIPWRRAWQPTSVFLPGESHGLQSTASQRLRYDWVHSRHAKHRGRKIWTRMCIYICIPESPCCTAEINTTLNINSNLKKLPLGFHKISCGCQGSWCIFCSEKMNQAGMKEMANSCRAFLITSP